MVNARDFDLEFQATKKSERERYTVISPMPTQLRWLGHLKISTRENQPHFLLKWTRSLFTRPSQGSFPDPGWEEWEIAQI